MKLRKLKFNWFENNVIVKTSSKKKCWGCNWRYNKEPLIILSKF